MKELLVALVELQKIEVEVDKIRAAQKNLPLRLNELDAEFNELCAEFDQKKLEFEEQQKIKREKDRQLLAGQDAMKKTKGRLSEVKTNKEYQSMLKEIETSTFKSGKLEEEIIGLLEKLEGAANEMKLREAQFEAARRNHEEKKQKLKDDIESLTEKLEESAAKSVQLRQALPADVLRKYDRIKTFANGVAIVPVWKEVCYGCHMAIPPQMYNEIQQKTELMTCPNCNRILYWEDRSN